MRRRALEQATLARPDLALVDLGLGGAISGPATAAQLGSRFDVPVVYLGDGADAVDGAHALWQRAAIGNPLGCLLRPFGDRQLYLTIETALAAQSRARRAEPLQLRQRVERLQHLNRCAQAVLDGMSEGVVAVGKDRVPLLHNASALRICGDRTAEGDIDSWARKFILYRADGETRLAPEESPLAVALSGAAVEEVDLVIRNEHQPHGVHVRVSGRPLTNENGESHGAVIVFRDITRMKQAEAELKQTLGRLEQQSQLMENIFSRISDGVVVADHSGNFMMFNPGAEQIVGIGELDLNTEEWSETYGVFQPGTNDHVPTEQLPLVRAIRGEATDNVELFIRNGQRPEGVFISVSGRPLNPDEVGDRGGVIVFRDVTRQKRADAELAKTMAELRNQNDLMNTAFESISDGIVVANAAGEFLYVNPAAEQIVGMGITNRPVDEWTETYGAYYPDRETPMATENLPLLRAIFGGESVDEEDVFIRNPNRPDGVYIRVSARPLRNNVGGIRGGVIVFRDVTERKFAEDALALAFAEGRLEVVETILHNIGNAITSVTTASRPCAGTSWPTVSAVDSERWPAPLRRTGRTGSTSSGTTPKAARCCRSSARSPPATRAATQSW